MFSDTDLTMGKHSLVGSFHILERKNEAKLPTKHPMHDAFAGNSQSSLQL